MKFYDNSTVFLYLLSALSATQVTWASDRKHYGRIIAGCAYCAEYASFGGSEGVNP